MTNDGLPEPAISKERRELERGIGAYKPGHVSYGYVIDKLEAYVRAEIAAAIAQERDRCAKLCEETAKQLYDQSPCIQEDESPDGAYACAAAIRGQAEGERG